MESLQVRVRQKYMSEYTVYTLSILVLALFPLVLKEKE